MKKLGRPPKDTEAVNVRLAVEVISKIDKARKDQPDLPSRPEMIRRMIYHWLSENTSEKDQD